MDRASSTCLFKAKQSKAKQYQRCTTHEILYERSISFLWYQNTTEKGIGTTSEQRNRVSKKEDWAMISKEVFVGNYNREIQYAIGDMLRPRAKKEISIREGSKYL
jgi:hypothetical protein